MSKKILITAGGTGGHFFPAIAFYEYLKERKLAPILITDKRCIQYIPDHLKGEVKVIDVRRLSKSPISIVRFLISLTAAFFRNMFTIISRRRRVVYSFGGYTSVAVLLAAIVCKCRIILVEENIIPGRANVLFARFAKQVAFGFSDTSHVPDKLRKKIIVTGIPVRKVKMATRTDEKFTIFIVGGSQGAQIFNDLVPRIMMSLPRELQKKIKLIQQVRSENIKDIDLLYKEKGYDYEIAPFFQRADEIIANSDLIISRSGASTIAEIISADKYALLVPYKKAKDNHQYYNAKYLEQEGVAQVFTEDNLDIERFKRVIESRINTPRSLKEGGIVSEEIKENLYKLS